MTMQTNFLPTQLVAPSPAPASARTNAPAPSEGLNFGATLTRQIEQRALEQRQALMAPQAQPQAQAQPLTPPAKPQAAAKPAANEAKAPAREPAREPARDSSGTAEADKAAAAPAQASAATKGEQTQEEAGAKASDAVVDMLALMASLNTVQPMPAAVAPDALEKAAAQPDVAGAPLMQADDALLANTHDDAGRKAQPGIDLRALDLGKAGDAVKLPVERGEFAARLHDSVAQAATVNAAAPDAAALGNLGNLANQATALQNAQAAGTVPTDRLSARVGTPAWDNQVGQKVIWMVGGEEQSATLELNPPDLGPVQVVLNVSNDMASVTFSSQQLEVRQALENALPRLREMMSESGIALGNASVNAGSEGRHGQDGQGSSRPRGAGGNSGDGGDGVVAEVAPRARTSILGGAGAVDTFA